MKSNAAGAAAPRIRIGVSGLGRIGWLFHCEQIFGHPDFELAAVQDPEASRLKEAAERYGVPTYTDLGGMLAGERLDAVVIASPTHLHARMTRDALRAGCHVLLEKPMAINGSQAAGMVRLAARRRRVLAVHMPRRAEAYFQHLCALVRSGYVGRVYHVRVGMYQFAIRNDWQALKRYGGGLLANWGTHAMDLMLALLEDEVTVVFSSMRKVASAGDTEDVLTIALRTLEGAVGIIEINHVSAVNPCYIDVTGTRGTISIAPDSLGQLRVRRVAPGSVHPRVLDPSLASAGRRYPDADVSFEESVLPVDSSRAVNVFTDFARAIRAGSPPLVPASNALRVVRLLHRCRRKAGKVQVTSIFDD